MLSGPEESNLVRAAAAGDGPAFARLYEAYERRIFNYLLRLVGDRHEAEDATQEAFIKVMAKLPDLDPENLEFGAYLYTAARNAGYDVIGKRKKLEPSGAVPEEAEAPFRGELSDLESDPERSALAGSQELAVQTANERLPERQREVLALRELDGLSYDEIAGVMEMKANAVAQLISRARIALRKEMRIGAAASVAFATADCERAHGEIACRQDGQTGVEEGWLDAHLADCGNCRVASEEMAEAGVSYRAWTPILPGAWLFREVMAKASEINGHDWSNVERPDPDPSSSDGLPREPRTPAGGARRAVLVGAGSVLVAGLFAFLLLGEANAPERTAEVRQLIIEPVTKDRKTTVRNGFRQKSGKQVQSGRQNRGSDQPTGAVSATGSENPGPNGGSNGGNPPSSGGSTGGGGNFNPGGSSDPRPTGGGETPDPVEPTEPTTPTPPDPVDPVDPTPPDPTPIPGGPPNLAIPGGPTPG